MNGRARVVSVAMAGFLLAGTVTTPAAAASRSATLVRASAPSSFPADCAVDDPTGVNYPNAEVEPWITADPRAEGHAVAVWQQDRWSDGGARGLVTGVTRDGGRTWTRTAAHFTTCSGGTSANGGDYERASDPWITTLADGTLVQEGLSFDTLDGRQAILTSRSTNGGRTWSEPAVVATDDSIDAGLDKESVTGDPKHRNLVYATWDRTIIDDVTGLVTVPTYFARSTNGGRSWETPTIVHDPGTDGSTIGAQVVVLPNGDLLDMFVVFGLTSADVTVARSHDRGTTWSAPMVVGSLGTIGVVDVKTGEAVRTGDIIPDIAVDRESGRVYVAWQDARFSGFQRDGIVLAHSDDDGTTWSSATQVNAAPNVQAFTASVDVTDDGTVGVTYYDFRNDTTDPATLLTDTWLATSRNGGRTWSERRLGDSFDMRTAPDAGGFFVGDYTGLDHHGDTFLPFFAVANSGNTTNRTDVFAALVGDPGDDRDHGRVERNDQPRSIAERVLQRRRDR